MDMYFIMSEDDDKFMGRQHKHQREKKIGFRVRIWSVKRSRHLVGVSGFL